MNQVAVMARSRESGSSLGAAFGAPDSRGFIALLEAFRATGGNAPGEIAVRLLEDHGVCSMAGLADLVFIGDVFGFEWCSCL